MLKRDNKKVKLLDCTIRDGGYVNNWRFNVSLVREVYRALSKAGVDYFEIGYRGSSKYFNRKEFGLWRFSGEENIRQAVNGISGPAVSIMADYRGICIEDFICKKDSVVKLVRLAAHKHQIKDALSFLNKIGKLGYKTSIQAMGYSSYTQRERKNFKAMLSDADIGYAYIADSYGSFLPYEIKGIFEPLLEISNGIKIGFHPHNSLQMAFANSIEAIRCGVDIVDSSIFGMGRGAGNLPTEIILAYLSSMRPDKYNVIPILDCIEKYFILMKEQMKWGYQLPYMLSGLFKSHPSYVKSLIDFKEFTMEDIWRILDCLKKKNITGYSKDALDEIINQGIYSSRKSTTNNKKTKNKKRVEEKAIPVSYINKHKERSFLILGNGPTLKQYKADIGKFIKKYDPVVMGANYLAGMFVPDYHAFSNKRRFAKYADTVDSRSKLLISEHIPAEMISEYTDRKYELIRYVDVMSNDFAISKGIVQCNCRTISILLMGIAIVMGAENIFAAGLDGYLNIDNNGNLLFYDELDSKADRGIIISMHRANDRYISQINEYLIAEGKEGVHILTPTSYGKFYKGISNYIE